MNIELGVYSFGSVQRDAGGELGSTAQAMRNLVEAIQVADQVGLDYFGVGEHHTRDMPASAAATILAGAATTTSRIRLGSSVTVLSTDDPVRVFEQFATVDAISAGRAEITAGRGSSVESFPLFGYDLSDYDDLYREKLELLLEINRSERVTWKGAFRPALEDALIVPRPDRGSLPIWLGTGGNPGSSVRAGGLGLPIAYGVVGGEPERFAPLAQLYLRAAEMSHADPSLIRIAVATPGYIDRDGATARDRWWTHYAERLEVVAPLRGFPMPSRRYYDRLTQPGGSHLVGSPEEIAERIVAVHRAVGNDRHILEMDYGQLPHSDLLRSIELLGTEVKPLVERELSS